MNEETLKLSQYDNLKDIEKLLQNGLDFQKIYPFQITSKGGHFSSKYGTKIIKLLYQYGRKLSYFYQTDDKPYLDKHIVYTDLSSAIYYKNFSCIKFLANQIDDKNNIIYKEKHKKNNHYYSFKSLNYALYSKNISGALHLYKKGFPWDKKDSFKLDEIYSFIDDFTKTNYNKNVFLVYQFYQYLKKQEPKITKECITKIKKEKKYLIEKNLSRTPTKKEMARTRFPYKQNKIYIKLEKQLEKIELLEDKEKLKIFIEKEKNQHIKKKSKLKHKLIERQNKNIEIIKNINNDIQDEDYTIGKQSFLLDFNLHRLIGLCSQPYYWKELNYLFNNENKQNQKFKYYFLNTIFDQHKKLNNSKNYNFLFFITNLCKKDNFLEQKENFVLKNKFSYFLSYYFMSIYPKYKEKKRQYLLSFLRGLPKDKKNINNHYNYLHTFFYFLEKEHGEYFSKNFQQHAIEIMTPIINNMIDINQKNKQNDTIMDLIKSFDTKEKERNIYLKKFLKDQGALTSEELLNLKIHKEIQNNNTEKHYSNKRKLM